MGVRKLYLLPFVALLLLLQYVFWFSHGGLLNVHRLKQQLAQQQAENQRLEQRGKSLYEEVLALKRGKNAVEEHARADLGMTKQGERFYQFVK